MEGLLKRELSVAQFLCLISDSRATFYYLPDIEEERINMSGKYFI